MTALPSLRPVVYAHGELSSEILDALSRVPSATAADLSAYLGSSDGPTRSALSRLRTIGAIVVTDRRDGRHLYALAGEDTGRAGRRADAAATQLAAIHALMTRAGVPTTALDGRLLSPVERVELALLRAQPMDKS
jgi:hypothetical protein